MKLNIKKSLSLALASMSLLLPSVSAVPPETSTPASTFISCVDFRELSCFKSDKDVFISAGNIARKIYEGCVIEEYDQDSYGTILPLRKIYMNEKQIAELDNLLVKIKESEDCRENADLYIIFCLINLYQSNGRDAYAEDAAASEWARIFEICRVRGDGHKKGIELFNEIFRKRVLKVKFKTAVDKDGEGRLVSRKWRWRKKTISEKKIEGTVECTDLTISFPDLSDHNGYRGLRCTIWH